MGDNDFPTVMGNQPIGFLQQYVKGSKMYSQKGDNVPEFTNKMGYSQQLGGPLEPDEPDEPMPVKLKVDAFLEGIKQFELPRDRSYFK